jgi:hypothetical protein
MKKKYYDEKGKLLFWERNNKIILKHRRNVRIIWTIFSLICFFFGVKFLIDYQLRTNFYIFGTFTAYILGSLFLIHIFGFTYLKVYENGISMPVRFILKTLQKKEYFIPFEKIDKIIIRKDTIELIIDDTITWNLINSKDIFDIKKFIKIIKKKIKKVTFEK